MEEYKKKSKIYKLLNIGNISNFRIVSMIPGDLRVARCIFSLDGFYG